MTEIKLKRKKEYPEDTCAAAGCRRKSELVFFDVEKKSGKKTVTVTAPLCPGCSEGLSPSPEDWRTAGSAEEGGKDGPIRAFSFADLARLSMKELPGVLIQWSISAEEVEMLVGTGLGVKRPDTGNQLHYEICWLTDSQKAMYKEQHTTAQELAAAFASVEVVNEVEHVQAEESVRHGVDEEHAEAKEMLEVVDRIAIASAEDEQFVAKILTDIKGKNKALEEMKQRALRPLRDSIKEITGWFKPVQVAYSEIERDLKGKVLVYRKKLEADRQAAREEMQESETVEEAREAKDKLAESQTPETEGIKVSKVWDYKVTDISQVPAQYVQLNKGAIRAAINKGTRDISGLHIFQKEVVASASVKKHVLKEWG